MDDTLQLREQLAYAWRETLDRVIERGAPAQVVIETMAAVAHNRFAESFGPAAAANYLQLLAEQLRDIDRKETETLIEGEAPPPADAGPSHADFGLAWMMRDDLL